MNSYNKIDLLPNIFNKVYTYQWTSRIENDLRFAEQEGWAFKSEYPSEDGNIGRKTFEIEPPMSISFYYIENEVKWVEVNLEVKYFDVLEMKDGEYDNLMKEFIGKVRSYSDELSKSYGDPSVSSNQEDSVKVYSWPKDDFNITLSLKNEDDEMPFRICLVVAFE